jgi:hypothetical protein
MAHGEGLVVKDRLSRLPRDVVNDERTPKIHGGQFQRFFQSNQTKHRDIEVFE